ncbi:TPA: exodeoxyribonuclease VII small subunit [Vibrio cholerae]|uniref:Exodeoxyribonuclease 7 small subunit n=8 Tax=Vibrio TaxID=662 RepID=EX7S_VIBCH|nr:MULTISPECIES: exodeoxyribonuclease VII small subunit [Vibrio]A5F333.1 RecName: Full=Exodeoxyribonuclease 7 small subunit; AltName: Full=Exodeoxyribonuclease VII small subunit; Short=Exonuclease VII small subunit [Vibrio cholerae O395]C3LTE1.1 RecName: Full=Exodeoxyribonuclease 7 small subunit; AltName: Full=Exodeoxyribonuclease VII small subunit; Short=Exonuclease VII small subunit [Vibrio cholerae M66-2]Q9KTL1.1 RecName: Full=Exodeoxyribonuclease 7 small subunit; AltName: Full=Exodeoxyribonu
MASKKPENMSFESTIEELEQLVEQLESGDLALDEALRKFERGISLARAGQLKLDDAEQRVRILLSNSDDAPLSDFSDVAE